MPKPERFEVFPDPSYSGGARVDVYIGDKCAASFGSRSFAAFLQDAIAAGEWMLDVMPARPTNVRVVAVSLLNEEP